MAWVVAKCGFEDRVQLGPWSGVSESGHSEDELAAAHRKLVGQWNEMSAWIRTLGHDPTNVIPRAVVVQSRAGEYELHLSEFVLGEAGQRQLDLAAGHPYSRPLVIPVEKDSWPYWMYDGLTV